MVVIAIVVESSCTLRANQLLRRFTPLIALRCRLRCASLFLLSGSEMLKGFGQSEGQTRRTSGQIG